MAVDDALLDSVQDGAPPVLRLYRWSPACLSFGRNQAAVGVYDPARLRGAGIDVVRRPTGGLAVLHDQELTYAVVAPAGLLGGPRAAYHAINAALIAGLAAVGAPAALATGDHAARPASLEPCFHAPSAGEVIAGGGKLVGSAQRCERHTILQHGSILMDGDQGGITAFQYEPGAHRAAGTTLRAVLGSAPDVRDLTAAIIAGFESAVGTRLAPCGLSEREQANALALCARYESDEWTWRR